MNGQIDLIEGTTRDLSKSQWFTPPELAQRVVEWAGVKHCMCGDTMACFRDHQPRRVLEPSAGNGALVRPLVAAGAEVVSVELDTRYFDDLVRIDMAARVLAADFLELDATFLRAPFDLCVMNPPYENGLDVAFILHALKFAPRVVGIFQAGIEYGVDRYDSLWSKVRPTRLMKLKRRWFKDPVTGKGGETNYLVAELVALRYPELHGAVPHAATIEWW